MNELTDRELDICHLLAKGFSNKKIGKELGIEESSVKAVIWSINKKWKTDSRLQIAIKYIKSGGK